MKEWRSGAVLTAVLLLTLSIVVIIIVPVAGYNPGDLNHNNNNREPSEIKSDIKDPNTGVTRTFKLRAGETKYINDGQFRIHSFYGTVYSDVDGDSEFTESEKRIGLPGAVVQLFDLEGISVEKSYSNNGGEWSLFVEPNHDYYVQFSCPPTYILTFKSAYTCGGEGAVLVDDRTIRSRSFTVSLSGRDIVGPPVLSGCLCYYPARLEGTVFEDVNMNQIRDSVDENGISNIKVQLRYQGFISGSAPAPDQIEIIESRSNAQGHFDFGNRLRPGVYEVSYLDIPRNYVPSEYSAEEEGRGIIYTITLRSGDKKVLEQGFYSLAEVTGVVWEDTNADGVWGKGEQVLSNIEVKLIRLPENKEVASVYSDEGGRYTFSKLPIAEYYVKFMKKSPDFKHSEVIL